MSISEYLRWLKRDWAKVGLIVSIFLFIFLFVFVKPQDFVVFLILLQTPLYMLHESEEYIFPGGFGRFFNQDIFKLKSKGKPLDENFIFYVNVFLIWILLPGFGLLSTIDYRFGLWIPYFSFFAGVAHIALSIKSGKFYNPGMIVSLVLNIPVGIGTLIYLTNQQILQNVFLNPHLLIGLGLNLLLPVMGGILYKRYIKSLSASNPAV